MSTKTFSMLSAIALFGAALVAPSAALAQFPPPPGPPPGLAGPPPGFAPGGPPPGLGAGGPPPGAAPQAPLAGLASRGLAAAAPREFTGAPSHFSRPGGAAGLQGLDRAGRANFRGVEGRAASHSANYMRTGYAGYSHGYRYWPYAAAAAYAYGRSHVSPDDGCYYMSASRRNGSRRVLVCPGN
jgi:hypothetical protein